MTKCFMNTSFQKFRHCGGSLTQSVDIVEAYQTLWISDTVCGHCGRTLTLSVDIVEAYHLSCLSDTVCGHCGDLPDLVDL